MDFWGNKINVSKEAAAKQIEIINNIPSKKRFQIALSFANMGVDRTRKWIKENNPQFSELEITLEFVRLIYFEKNEMSETHWKHFKKIMKVKIRKNWSERFRNMMIENDWTYENIAILGGFKNGKVIEATVSRGLPSFAKLAVVVFEKSRKQKNEEM